MSEPPVLATAFFLGLWTSLTPCPLATNIAAFSYIARGIAHRRFVLLSGLLYTVGRATAYSLLGAAIVLGLLGAPQVSRFLSVYLNKLLGPILILVGMILLELLNFSFGGSTTTQKLATKVEALGPLGALLLGIIFALSFCPISAAIFFGSLLTLATKAQSPLLVPAAFGIATALPVALFAMLIALGVSWIGSLYNKVTLVEKVMRTLAGIAFIIVGIYVSLVYIFKVL